MNNDFQAQAYNENEMINELLDRVEKHDYSYMMSDVGWVDCDWSDFEFEQVVETFDDLFVGIS